VPLGGVDADAGRRGLDSAGDAGDGAADLVGVASVDVEPAIDPWRSSTSCSAAHNGAAPSSPRVGQRAHAVASLSQDFFLQNVQHTDGKSTAVIHALMRCSVCVKFSGRQRRESDWAPTFCHRCWLPDLCRGQMEMEMELLL